MKSTSFNSFIKWLPLLALAGCAARSESPEAMPSLETTDQAKFRTYWYQGKAELNRFALTQARYGELREGDAVMVFVTEDFLTESQVKLEMGSSEPATPILKLNFVKKFKTGIYDYSMMSSVFSSTDRKAFPHALKVTTSSQEWCGHTYLQLNNRGEQFAVKGHSYFQNEGDEDYNLASAWLEDELWSLIRLEPSALPTGEISVIPGTMYARLKHKNLDAQKANAAVSGYSGSEYPGVNLMNYSLNYDNGRTLSIIFEGNQPYRIAGWEESYRDGWGNAAKNLTTKAIRTHQLMEPYWGQNANADEGMRQKLGL